MKDLLTNHMLPGGLLFFAVPVGRDTVVFNAHRIYGYVVDLRCTFSCVTVDPIVLLGHWHGITGNFARSFMNDIVYIINASYVSFLHFERLLNASMHRARF